MIEQKAALLAVYGVLLLAACVLPFALLLRTYTYPPASTIDRVFGAMLALGDSRCLPCAGRRGSQVRSSFQ